jgi:uncharacterized membrane protein
LHTQGHHHQDSRSFSITMNLSMCFVFVTIIKLIQLFSAMGALAKAIMCLLLSLFTQQPTLSTIIYNNIASGQQLGNIGLDCICFFCK